MAAWVGWVTHFWQTSFLLPIGMILGMAISIYLVIKRYGGTT